VDDTRTAKELGEENNRTELKIGAPHPDPKRIPDGIKVVSDKVLIVNQGSGFKD
jgi:hypothetical protein